MPAPLPFDASDWAAFTLVRQMVTVEYRLCPAVPLGEVYYGASPDGWRELLLTQEAGMAFLLDAPLVPVIRRARALGPGLYGLEQLLAAPDVVGAMPAPLQP